MAITGLMAWDNAARGENSRWVRDVARFDAVPTPVRHTAKFALSTADRVFCIGSCFARNIEEYLIYAGVEVLSKRIVSPKHEHGETVRANAIVNKFTTASMLNEAQWTLERPVVDERFFEPVAGGWHDLQLAPGGKPVTLERAVERRRYLIEDYFARLRQADVTVVTLGLTEAWQDMALDRYLNGPPGHAALKALPERYRLDLTDAAANIDNLEALCAALWALNPAMRVVVTVSPVPMGRTFSGRDVLVANTASKSILRAAAEAISRRHEAVDYFPSFEMVSAAPRALAYIEDRLHVADAVVGEVVRTFMQAYMGLDLPVTGFNEPDYLRANPDVEQMLREGRLASGFEHWNTVGRDEGRPQAPR